MAAAHAHKSTGPAGEVIRLGPRARPLFMGAAIAGAGGLVLTLLLGFMSAGGIRRFYFAYLVGFSFWLTIALGALVFVLIQYVTRAGWSVSVRRVAECLAATFPILAALSAPIIISVALQKGDLYRWALPMSAAQVSPGPRIHEAKATKPIGDHVPEGAVDSKANEAHVKAEAAGTKAGEGEVENAEGEAEESNAAKPVLDELTLKKRVYLNPAFFIARMLLYFAVWSAVGWYYWRQSLLQDRTGDVRITERLQSLSAPALVAVALTLTFAAFDLLMSLDPHWFSTMFGVYIFIGGFQAFFATIIVLLYLLQRFGCLRDSVSIEHYHDLGKFLFGFVFFWGYIAFSQYMLLWYANIPEETEYLSRHGMTTAHVAPGIRYWSYWSIALLFGRLLIPFGGLLSRHVKRNTTSLVFWAVWLLVFHFVDLCWVVLPEFRPGAFTFNLIDVTAVIGVGGVVVAALARMAANYNLRPTADPRLHEALAFHNI